MNTEPRQRLTDRVAGRLIVLAAVSILVVLMMRADAQPERSVVVDLVAATLVVFGGYALFELAASAVGFILARTPVSAERRLQRSERRRARRAQLESRTGPVRARQALVLFAAYLIAHGTVWGSIGMLALGEGDSVDMQRLVFLTAPGMILSFLGAGAVVVLLYRRWVHRLDALGGNLNQAIGLRVAPLRSLAVAAVSGILLGGAILLLSSQVPMQEDVNRSVVVRAAQTPGMPQLGWAVAVVFLAPPLEEFVFRGVMLEGLRRSWGPWVAGFVVTVLFVGMHLFEYWHYWPALLGITMTAVALLLARVRTGSLAPSIALHFGYNLAIVAGVLAFTGR